ncbi:MAG: diphthine--ammonia ligase [Thaumarchaeota archaeon]|nr:diphthine--ammonia ligase [Nitrososphaerota archaeon]
MVQSTATKTLKAGVLFSGGKDSTYASMIARQRDSLECLVTMSPRREDSYMFHHPNVKWTGLQAQSIGVPHLIVETEGVKEVELEDLSRALRTAKDDFGIQGIYTGALASVYQKTRVERISGELGLEAVSPLWHLDPEKHLQNLLAQKFEVIFTAVAALGLDEKWLGRILDDDAIQELVNLHSKYGVNVGLEGGEGETLVTDCPIFGSKLEIQESEKVWKGDHGYLRITKVRLLPK